MSKQTFTDSFKEKSLSHSAQWNESFLNEQCNVLLVSIFAIFLPKSGSFLAKLNKTFETYDEDVWFKEAENLGELIESMRLNLIQTYNLEVR